MGYFLKMCVEDHIKPSNWMMNLLVKLDYHLYNLIDNLF